MDRFLRGNFEAERGGKIGFTPVTLLELCDGGLIPSLDLICLIQIRLIREEIIYKIGAENASVWICYSCNLMENNKKKLIVSRGTDGVASKPCLYSRLSEWVCQKC